MSDVLKDFLGSGFFWAALTTLLFALQAWLLPTMPQSVVDSLHALAVVIFGIIAARYAVKQSQVRADAVKLQE